MLAAKRKCHIRQRPRFDLPVRSCLESVSNAWLICRHCVPWMNRKKINVCQVWLTGGNLSSLCKDNVIAFSFNLGFYHFCAYFCRAGVSYQMSWNEKWLIRYSQLFPLAGRGWSALKKTESCSGKLFGLLSSSFLDRYWNYSRRMAIINILSGCSLDYRCCSCKRVQQHATNLS